MTSRYLLSCPKCDNRIPVETAQAGGSVRCARCGTSTRLGTLREIKALPRESARIEEGESPKSQSQPWSSGRRAAFTVGLFLLIAGLLSAVYAWRQASGLQIDRPDSRLSPAIRDAILRMPPIDVIKRWEEESSRSVDQWVEAGYLKNRRDHWLLEIWKWAGLAIGAAGLAGIAWGLVSKNPQTTRRPRRRE